MPPVSLARAAAEGRVYRHPATAVDLTVRAADPGAMHAVGASSAGWTIRGDGGRAASCPNAYDVTADSSPWDEPRQINANPTMVHDHANRES
jgi:hypothetical protein